MEIDLFNDCSIRNICFHSLVAFIFSFKALEWTTHYGFPLAVSLTTVLFLRCVCWLCY